MTTNAGHLRKYCDCNPERHTKCRHAWTFKVHTEAWGEIYVALRQWIKNRRLTAADLRAIGIAKGKIETKGDAEALVLKIRQEIIDGIDPRKAYAATTTDTAPASAPAAEPEGGATVKAAGDSIVLALGSKLANPKELRTYYNRINAVAIADGLTFGSLRVEQVSEDHVLAVFQSLTEGRSNSYRRKYRRMLRRIFTLALRRGWITVNPITPETELTAGVCAMRQERIPFELEDRIIAAAKTLGVPGARLADLIVACVECGARKGELLAMQARDVKIAEGVIVIAAREQGGAKKGIGNGRIVPITPRLEAVLVRRLEAIEAFGPKAYVFGDEAGERIHEITGVWERALLVAHGHAITWGKLEAARPGKGAQNISPACRARVGEINKTFYDLRHEAALRWHEGTGSLSAPLELTAIAKLLGHSDLAQLRVYLGIQNDDAIAAFRRATGAGLRGIAGGKGKAATAKRRAS